MYICVIRVILAKNLQKNPSKTTGSPLVFPKDLCKVYVSHFIGQLVFDLPQTVHGWLFLMRQTFYWCGKMEDSTGGFLRYFAQTDGSPLFVCFLTEGNCLLTV